MSSFYCPITLEIMNDPVILVSTSQTFERKAIEEWFLNNNTDPLSNRVLSPAEQVIIPNIALRHSINEFSLNSSQIMPPKSKARKLKGKKMIIDGSPLNNYLKFVSIISIIFFPFIGLIFNYSSGSMANFCAFINRTNTFILENKDEVLPLIDNPAQVNTKDNVVYEGQISNKILNGHGTLLFKDGSRFVGDFKNGKRHGIVVYIAIDGTTMTANWENDIMIGECSIQYKNGNTYRGGVKDFKRNGYGTMNFYDGSTFIGQFYNDTAQGYGELDFKVYIYKGDFKDGSMSGFGKFTWKNGKFLSYEGLVEDGVPHGYGKLVFQEGHTYTGPIRYGKPHGKGKVTFGDNQRKIPAVDVEFDNGNLNNVIPNTN